MTKAPLKRSEGVNEWPRRFCFRLRGVHSVIAGQWKPAWIRTTRSPDGKVKEGHFNLGAVSEVRNKIANACDWTKGSVDEPVGSIDRQERR